MPRVSFQPRQWLLGLLQLSGSAGCVPRSGCPFAAPQGCPLDAAMRCWALLRKEAVELDPELQCKSRVAGEVAREDGENKKAQSSPPTPSLRHREFLLSLSGSLRYSAAHCVENPSFVPRSSSEPVHHLNAMKISK